MTPKHIQDIMAKMTPNQWVHVLQNYNDYLDLELQKQAIATTQESVLQRHESMIVASLLKQRGN